MSLDRSRPLPGSMPSFMHEDRKAAEVPKVVVPVCAARSHSTFRSGWPGLPSYSTISASVSSTPARKFHIIQPVVVNQNTRSPFCASTCRYIFFRCSSRMPPWPCTIALGSPVVPEL